MLLFPLKSEERREHLIGSVFIYNTNVFVFILTGSQNVIQNILSYLFIYSFGMKDGIFKGKNS